MVGTLAAGAVTVIGLLATIGWNQCFIAFHLIYFQPDTRTFSTTNTLIRLFLSNFWSDSAMAVSSITLIRGFILTTAGKHFGKDLM